MSEQWVKISTSLFDSPDIKQITALPRGDVYVVLWLKLICLAGKINDNGAIYFLPDLPYSASMLTAQLGCTAKTITSALSLFASYGMIEIINGIIYIKGWDRFHGIDGADAVRAYNRIAQQQYRQRKKKTQNVIDNVNDKSMTSQEKVIDTVNDIVKQKETEKERSKEKGKEKDLISSQTVVVKENHISTNNTQACPYDRILDLYNTTCLHLPNALGIEGERRKALDALWEKYPDISIFETVFKTVNSSDFLNGDNKIHWIANFDWIINSANFLKIFEKKYNSKFEKIDGNFEEKTGSEKTYNLDDFFSAAIQAERNA